MEELNHPLDDHEFQKIDSVLQKHAQEGSIADCAELDGFLTAIASAPVTIQPTDWLPMMFSGVEPDWEDGEFEEFFQLVIRHLNSTALLLSETPETFEAMFHIELIEGKEATIPNFWCNGYLRGVDLCAEAWRSLPESHLPYFNAIFLFGTEEGLAELDKASDEDVEKLHEGLEEGVVKLHAYWTSRDTVNVSEKKTN